MLKSKGEGGLGSDWGGGTSQGRFVTFPTYFTPVYFLTDRKIYTIRVRQRVRCNRRMSGRDLCYLRAGSKVVKLSISQTRIQTVGILLFANFAIYIGTY